MDALQKGLNISNVHPAIDCKKYDQFYDPVLTRVKLCFNKSLELIGCEGLLPQGIWGNCPQEGFVFYPRDEKNYVAVATASKLNSQSEKPVNGPIRGAHSL